ncbi:MAG TPA: hypothetical protein VER03_11640 [Bryobacteraceae bacterium]|nr:hypothetical protein [Bryobacteraceae bacterium]
MPEDKPADTGSGGSEPDFVKAALKWQYNWIGLAGAAAFALVSGSGLPLVLAAGLELIYVAVVPQSSRFRRLVRSWQYAEEKRKHEEKTRLIFNELPDAVKARYSNIVKVCYQIRANYDKLSSSSQIFVSQMDEKLQSLLYGYVRLLQSAQHQQQYLQSSSPSVITREVRQIESALPNDPPKVQEINRKRIEILNKRLEKFEKIKENSKVIDAQCAAIEDVLQLIRDQSMTMRDPQELTYRIDSLVQDVESTESTVREMEAIFDMGTQELAPMLPDLQSDPTPAKRNRLMN